MRWNLIVVLGADWISWNLGLVYSVVLFVLAQHRWGGADFVLHPLIYTSACNDTSTKGGGRVRGVHRTSPVWHKVVRCRV